jgi:hypothetical protein
MVAAAFQRLRHQQHRGATENGIGEERARQAVPPAI